MLAPIVLFVYNRPWHTAQTLEALKKNYLALNSDLFIFSDGPKNEQAKEKVFEVRKLLKTVTGFKKITIIEKETNIGLANSVINGVTEIINEYRKIIVIEDDIITAPYFLKYMNNALDLYETENKVMQISGYMFPIKFKTDMDAIFLPLTTSWGWATWKRAWQNFDPLMLDYKTLLDDKQLKKKFNLNGNYDYLNLLKLQKERKVDSWAIRWYLSVFMKNGLVLFPRQSLVNNIGFDGTGIHCGKGKICGSIIPEFEIKKYPNAIRVFDNENLIYKYFKKNQGIKKMIMGKWNEIFKRTKI